MHWDRPTENNLSNMIILCGQRIEGKILKNLTEGGKYIYIWEYGGKGNEKNISIPRLRLAL